MVCPDGQIPESGTVSTCTADGSWSNAVKCSSACPALGAVYGTVTVHGEETQHALENVDGTDSTVKYTCTEPDTGLLARHHKGMYAYGEVLKSTYRVGPGVGWWSSAI